MNLLTVGAEWYVATNNSISFNMYPILYYSEYFWVILLNPNGLKNESNISTLMFRIQLAFIYFWAMLRSIYRSVGFGPQDPPDNNAAPVGYGNPHIESSAPATGSLNSRLKNEPLESDPSIDLNKTTVPCEVKPEQVVSKLFRKKNASNSLARRAPRVWLWEIFPFRMEKNLIHNDFLLKLRDRKGPVVSAKIPFVGEVVVCIGTDFARAYHHLTEEQASILKGFEFFFKLSMPKEMTEKVTSDSRVNGFLRKSLTTDRFVGFIDLMRNEVKNYFSTHWNKTEMEIDLFPQVYKMVIYFLYRCLIGATSAEQFEEFYHAFRDLDVEENLGSPTRIINNLTIGRYEIERKWQNWKKVIQGLVDRPKPEEEVFFEVITKASTDEKTGLFDLGSLATRILWIFFAGSANNFAAISWLLVLIYSPENAHILKELQDQSEEYNYRYRTKDGMVDFMTYDRDPTKRNLVDRCVQEVVRMCAAALSFRKAEVDFTLDNGNESFLIKKGTMLGLAYGTVMNDPKVFSNTDVFNPDRFKTEGIVNENQIAFGVGQHPCTGRNLVSITVKTFLYLFFEYYDAKSPGKARDFFPQQQPVGIFRPPRPVMFKLMRKKEFEEKPIDPSQSG